MPYKNIRDRRAASKRHYEANRAKYMERNKRYRLTIKEFVKNLKEKTPCSDCEKNYPYYVMDFDHLEDKKNLISFLASTGRIGTLKKEVTKCEVVCANCHRERTHQRSSKRP